MEAQTVVPADIPYDANQAKVMLQRIEAGELRPHATYEKEILETLRLTIEGKRPNPAADIFGDVFSFPPEIQSKLKKLSTEQLEEMLASAFTEYCEAPVCVRISTQTSYLGGACSAQYELGFMLKSTNSDN